MNCLKKVSVSSKRNAHIILEMLKHITKNNDFDSNVSHPCANGLFALRSSLVARLDDPKRPQDGHKMTP